MRELPWARVASLFCIILIHSKYYVAGQQDWGDWSEPSACSRTCGGGVQYQERSCLAETRDCLGPSKIYTSCSIEDCPEDSEDFRAEQCARYNNIAFTDKYHEWLPYYGGANKCELNCLAKGKRFYYRHAVKVIDGTRCDRDTTDVCVDGVCQKVGCDKNLGSTAKFDKCHICDGKSETCKTISGSLNVEKLSFGYNDVVLIPTGATSITFRELGPSNNYIALRNLDGEYYLNGNWVVDLAKPRKISGTTFKYERLSEAKDVEFLTADGPTTEPVFISVIRQKGVNSGIEYEYSIPEDVQEDSAWGTYSWKASLWSECSRSCASGEQTRDIKCTRTSDGSEVRLDLCDHAKKLSGKRDCNTHPCEAKWHIGVWEECSSTCGDGVQVRSVFCQQLTHDDIHTIVDSGLCKEEKPQTVQKCNAHVACPKWEVGQWTKCNRVCGEAEQTRQVICKAQHILADSISDILPEDQCDSNSRPVSSQVCILQPCEGREWVTSKWSGCHGSCAHGFETRQIVCSTKDGKLLDHEYCDSAKKPDRKRSCSQDHELCDNTPKWHASQWEECSARCGSGIQSRKVVCAVQDEGRILRIVDDNQCDPAHKMDAHQECEGSECQGVWFAAPWGECSELCGGGEIMREVLCFWEGEIAEDRECDADEKPSEVESCNNMACNEDELLPVGGCKNTRFGCCPDGFTVAEDANKLDCPSGDPIPTGLCIETKFGCCLDGVNPAKGPFLAGCKHFSCMLTHYGCCSDGKTAADDFNGKGCPAEKLTCDVTAFGCCPDGLTPAPNKEKIGCPPLCQSSEHGCCPDLKTPASDKFGAGCETIESIYEGSGEDCMDTKFGCCGDGITPVQDKARSNCNELLKGCQKSNHGCCPDGVTPASGKNLQGCPGVIVAPISGCKETRYGCCSDERTPRLGWNNEGCDSESAEIEIDDCENTLYGCCSDRHTIREDEDGSNCPPFVGGCAGTRHGCCPDGLTSSGANGEGCETVVIAGCETSVYGCCPDGITPADGYQLEGCNVTQKVPDCDMTRFGCCPDGRSVAAGGSFEGCPDENTYEESCTDSPFGCCPDNKTPAQGPHHALCPSRVDKGAKCGDNKERGECTDFSIMWYFDKQYGDCSRFWYGGCGGNGNRFSERQQCHDTCRSPKEHELDVCYLPKSAGRCSTYETRYFYNPDTQSCETFSYGGCLGNDNNFKNEDNCTQHCVIPQRPDICKQPQNTGPCKGQFVRWFYNSKSGMCGQFIYGGCKGNENRFESEVDCEQKCKEPSTKLCKLPKDPGPCKADYKRWYFNAERSECEEFIYGGCKGNANLFGTKAECEQGCSELIPKKEVDVCQLPQDKGPCKGKFYKYYYNRDTQYCEKFEYGGCHGNQNRFETEFDCRQTCNALAPIDVCTLESSSGSCGEYNVRFYFDTVSKRCEKFIYGGCDGNDNRFDSHQECNKACKHLVKEIEATGRDHCLLQPVAGLCIKNIPRWYYNADSMGCEQFIYGGCEGNRNRFHNHMLCEEDCHGVTRGMTTLTESTVRPTRRHTTPTTTTERSDIDVCEMQQDSGDCDKNIPMWFYDRESQSCSQFVYSGCGGNANKFDTRQECEQSCYQPDPVGIEICSLPSVQGPCVGEIDRWYYDAEKGRCLPFTFGGCEGNKNNYASQDECEAACPLKEICNLPQEVGPCRANKLRYNYDQSVGRCIEFYYGGCEGNANRFLDIDSCNRVCTEEEEKPIFTGNPCTQDKETGECSNYDIYWYYDTANSGCAQFYYGGCGGNNNRFASREECEQRCSAVTTYAPTISSETPDRCMKLKDPGNCTDFAPVWYFEFNSATCRRFYYGGCGGNRNNFATRDDCQSACLYSTGGGGAISEPPTVRTSPEDRRKVTTPTTRATTPTTTTTELPKRRTTTEHYKEHTTTSTTTTTTTTQIDQVDVTAEPGSVEVCFKRQKRGDCQDYSVRWYFDHHDTHCKRFWYGGCGSNGNNFDSEEACELRCLVHRATPTESRVPTPACSQPVNPGPCKASIKRWYFDSSKGICRDFVYGGCLGNENNFVKRRHCKEACVIDKTDKEVCELPKDEGPCKASKLRWYYDSAEGSCRQFRYGGCQGNYNNFETQQGCQDYCGSAHSSTTAETVQTGDSCYLPRQTGPCVDFYQQFYYDSATGECRPFLFGGCEGNTNRFDTQSDCYRLCSDYPESYPLLQPGDCYEQPEQGPCEGDEHRWYFDPVQVDCVAFRYGGCGGNKNHFRVFDDCWAYCSKVTETCGVFQCDENCPYGFARGSDGCPYCQCADACQGYECPEHHKCVLEEVTCVTEPCLPAPVCAPIPKPGECPVLEQDQALCLFECAIDYDCFDDAKCCDTGCGQICASPGAPGVGGDRDRNRDYTYNYYGEDVYGGIDPSIYEIESDLYNIDDDRSGGSSSSSENVIDEDYNPAVHPSSADGCPAIDEMDPMLRTVCIDLCTSDIDCPKMGKCCFNGCGHVCMLVEIVTPPPLPSSGCAASVFGCCPDGKTYATGWNYIGCNEEAPVIEKVFTLETATAGDTVRLPCNARGAPAPQISWYKNRKPLQRDLQEDPRFTTYSDGSLSIFNVKEEDASNYSCRAHNSIGSDTHTYTVVLTVPPKLRPTKTTIEALVGAQVQLECIVEAGKPEPSIRWYYNDELVILDDVHYSESEENVLFIRNAQEQDSGRYECEVNNGVGQPRRRTFKLTIGVPKVPIVIQIEGQRKEYKSGDELLLYCMVPTTERVRTKWLRDGEPVEQDTNSVEQIDSSELYIKSLAEEDSGTYECRVATEDGRKASNKITIDVKAVVPVPADCADQPWYANCQLIVDNNYCDNKYYKVFCCKSCHLAGFLRKK